MSLYEHLDAVQFNSKPLRPEEWEIRDGKLWIDFGEERPVSGDSVLLISKNEDAWRSRRVMFGAGGQADLYFHPDVLSPPQKTTKRVIPPTPTRAPERSDLTTSIKQLGLSEDIEQALLDIESEIRGAYEESIEELKKQLVQAQSETADLRAKIDRGRKALE